MNKIKVIAGDICTVDTGVIVHGCNAQGVMGSGVAKAIRSKYPQVFEDYKNHEQAYGYELGDIVSTQIIDKEEDIDIVIVSAITQLQYGKDKRRYVNYEALAVVFESIENIAKHFGHTQVHFPLIGCGLGGGSWEVVSAIIEASAPNIDKFLWVDSATSDIVYVKKHPVVKPRQGILRSVE